MFAQFHQRVAFFSERPTFEKKVIWDFFKSGPLFKKSDMVFFQKRPAFEKMGPPFGKAGARGVKWMFMLVRLHGYAGVAGWRGAVDRR